LVAVIGNGDAETERDRLAEQVGALIARRGLGLVCGGLGGVMAAACRGARDAGPTGPVVAVLPGTDRADANPYADVVIPTGMGYARNLIVVLSADAVIAVGGASGTLSEMAHAWQLGKPICALVAVDGWAARLAGSTLDGKRSDAVYQAQSIADVEAWLDALELGESKRP
jgi:uncharacterized protein (TIGR00725 family)